MAYLDYEASADAGSPIEAYRISVGDDCYNLTSHDEDVVMPGTSDLFYKCEISSTAPRQSKEAEANKVEIRLPMTHALPKLFVQSAPPSLVRVKIWRWHQEDPDEEVRRIYNGRTRGPRWEDNQWAVFECETNYAAMRRSGLRWKYQNPCNHATYVMVDGYGCPAVEAAHTTAVTATTVAGDTITISGAIPSGRLRGGKIIAANGDRRGIASHIGNVLLLNSPFPASTLASGGAVEVVDGCGHLFADCAGPVFAAETGAGAAFGGNPTVPLINIFTTGLR